MSANFPPGPQPGQDPDQTTSYRTPQGQPAPPYQQDGQQYGAPHAAPQQQPYQQPQGQPYQQPQAHQQYQQPQGQQQPYGQHQAQAPGQPYGQPQQQPHQQQPYQQPQTAAYQQTAAFSQGAPHEHYQHGRQYQQGGWQQGPETLGTAATHYDGTPPAKKGGRNWLVAIIAALVVVLVGGGGVYAFTALSGGGAQPHDVLPGQNAIGYARLDLDPAANQKLALFEIARKFSATKESFAGDDLRKSFVSGLLPDLGATEKLDYDRDIAPWLGSRIGVVALPPARGSDEPDAVIAIQVTDQEQARVGLGKLFGGSSNNGIAFREDYALVTETQAAADKYATATTLAENTEFTDDIAALGEPGVLSMWLSAGKLAELSGQLPAGQAAQLEQLKNMRVVAALRFDGQYVELAGMSRGAEGMDIGRPGATPLGNLPASTAAALSFSGAGEALGKQWDQVTKAMGASPESASFQQFLNTAQQNFGLTLPGDLVTLLGDNITASLDAAGLSQQQINAGVRIGTGEPAKVKEVIAKIERVLASSGGQVPQLAKADGDGSVVLASTPQYAQQLAKGGTLGENETFQLAVADAGEATFGVFVDLDKIEGLYLQNMDAQTRANLQVLRAVGVSGKQTGSDGSFSLRVLFN
ncbi:DUF3352 domain-containing protein [Sinosporangium siamense]|uniref:DUF3352 domain-containing protein n=1 Tax=Sinosporangium siamense TaxID=1367973 RepID=A0A919RF82_9ACTN|nr:DUF3352 domain-containing protein [Sinosporangium siamense]GII91319.1 hypothetical protein Ssi02_15500 [Sinosporangium siamense]